MRRRVLLSGLLFFAVAWHGESAVAQTRWSVTPYAGILFTDGDLAGEGGDLVLLDDPTIPPGQQPEIRASLDVEDAALFGIRVGLNLDHGWSLEATYGYASFPVKSTLDIVTPVPEFDDPTTSIRFTLSDHGLHLWEGTVRYAFDGDRLRPSVIGGVGGATMSTSFPVFGDVPELDETTTDLALVLGGGIRWNFRSGVGIRLEVRDHLQWCDAACLGDETVLHQVEVSGGLEIDL